jgi:PPOX class probable F420-dependent enzyme
MADMTPQEIDAFLAEVRLCHFATIDPSGHPRVRPMWYVWRDRELWTSTRLHRYTGTDVTAGSSVAISIASEDRPYKAVIIHGRPEILPKTEERLLEISTRYGERMGRAWTAEVMQEDDRVLYRVTPDRIYSWDYAKDD